MLVVMVSLSNAIGCFFPSLYVFCLRLAFLWVSNQYVNIDAVPHLVRRPGAVTEG